MKTARLILPEALNTGETIREAALEAFENAFAAICGGATITRGTGLWVDPRTDRAYREPVRILDADLTSSFDEAELFSLAREAAKEFSQVVVYVRVNGRVSLVTPS